MKQKIIREIASVWKEDKRPYVKQSTFAAYMLILEKHILPYFGEMRILNEKIVQAFVLEKLNGGMSVKSVKDILIVLKMIMKFGVKNDWMNYSEWDVKYPTTEAVKEVEVLTVADHKKILNYIRQNFTFRNLGIYICLSSGLRIGEVCALRWSDIKELLSLVKPLKKVVNSDFYILTNEESPTEPHTYRNYYKQFMEKLGMPKLNFHGLRYSFATRCIECNCDYKTVSVLLGHAVDIRIICRPYNQNLPFLSFRNQCLRIAKI